MISTLDHLDCTGVHPDFSEAYANLWILIDEIDPYITGEYGLRILQTLVRKLDIYIGYFLKAHGGHIRDLKKFRKEWEHIIDTILDTISAPLNSGNKLSQEDRRRLEEISFGHMIGAIFESARGETSYKVQRGIQTIIAAMLAELKKRGHTMKAR